MNGKRKSLLPPSSSVAQAPEWDPKTKEPWFIEFEKEPVNDDKWNCIVTAAVPNEAEDEECIQSYIQCVNTGLRKSVKIISMGDVLKLLKTPNNGNKTEEKKGEKLIRRTPVKTRGQFTQVVELVAKYAIFTATECKLPPDLMAALLKAMILILKDENCLQKRINAVRERKIRERQIKEKFIRDMKPYEADREETKYESKVPPNILELEEPINDEPIAGPDLYIMLTNFYNVQFFPELQTLRVPFVAVLRIQTEPTVNSGDDLLGVSRKRSSTFIQFWEKFHEEYFVLANTSRLKEILMVEYEAPEKGTDLKGYYRVIFDDLTWTQYSVHCICRQHQKYLRQLHVQRQTLSLEPLALSKCEVYNKLSDALVRGEPITPLLVLYAMVEQVVVGVPQTDSVAEEYQLQSTDLLYFGDTPPEERPAEVPLVTPCLQCRGKKFESPCDKLKETIYSPLQTSEDDWIETLDENSILTQLEESSFKSTLQADPETNSSTMKTVNSLINKVLSERKTEKEIREDKRWKTPSLCFYGDSIFLQTYFCDPRLLDYETLVDRFLKNSNLPLIWNSYPELSPVERAYSNFHFNTLLKLSKTTEELLKLQIYFTLGMNLIGRKFSRGIGTPGFSFGDRQRFSSLSLHQSLLSLLKGNEKNFRSYFLRSFIAGLYFRQMGIQTGDVILESTNITESQFQTRSWNSGIPQTPGSSGDFQSFDTTLSSNDEKVLTNFHAVLNCYHISNLTDPDTPYTANFLTFVQDFKFYENLEPNCMIQRLVEAEENFNSFRLSYFPPTDTLIILLQNDFDERGIFYNTHKGVMNTPVGLKDFYVYLYPELTSWLIDEEAEHASFMAELAEKERAKEEKRDGEFLALLKRKFCSMSEAKRTEFLAEGGSPSIPTVKEKELGELPVKPKLKEPNRVSFCATNVSDLRVENKERIREFFSQDGTQVSVTINSWLYDPLELIRVRAKRSNFSLYYYQWVGYAPTTCFTLKTNSDIIFSSCIDENRLTISWPTGLLIRPVALGSGMYIRQAYLKPYRSGWEIEEEKSRCFLRNGQVLIFKSNGDYDILFGSGTKYAFYDALPAPRCEITSTTGEVWQVQTKGRCKNKRTLMMINKIFLGVDPNTKETFYKREEGTYCMLWPSGRLVTNYPDGTKITTTPYFEEEEVMTDWTNEERLFYEELESKHRQEQDPRSRTILRNNSTARPSEVRCFNVTGFVMISCSYLMEHPKYAGVYFDFSDPDVRLTMPEQITVLIHPEGNFEVQQDINFLKVSDSEVEFYTYCPDCKEKTTVKLYLNSNDVMCKCVDLFQQAFFVNRDGGTNFLERYQEDGTEELSELAKAPYKSNSAVYKCGEAHKRSEFLMQRCFALERDLSGVEFLHIGSLSSHFYRLPEETYFEMYTEDPANLCHTSNSPYFKVGYEKWTMDYEEYHNSLPTNLKKKDLKELGEKQVTRNTFKFPFPKHHNCGNQQQNEKGKRIVNEPKVIVSRTIRCLSPSPCRVMEELRKFAAEYQEKAVDIFNEYRKHKVADDRTNDSRYVEMRLRKIALTLNQSLHMYPHLCNDLPSTENDIHYFGHFINSMTALKTQAGDTQTILPNCKQIPRRLPKPADFSSIHEESESPRLT